MDRGAWQATIDRVTKESEMTQQLNNDNKTLLTGNEALLLQSPAGSCLRVLHLLCLAFRGRRSKSLNLGLFFSPDLAACWAFLWVACSSLWLCKF